MSASSPLNSKIDPLTPKPPGVGYIHGRIVHGVIPFFSFLRERDLVDHQKVQSKNHFTQLSPHSDIHPWFLNREMS